MKGSSKVLIGVSLGLVAGGIAGYFLATEEGQAFQLKTKERLRMLESDLKEGVRNNKEMVTEKLSTASENAKSWANDLSETVKDKLNTATEKVEDVKEELQSDFEKGVDTARRKIEEKTGTGNDILT